MYCTVLYCTVYLVKVVHGARLDHGEAELVVAAPVAVPQLHGEGDGLGARAPVRVVSSVVPQVVLGLGTGVITELQTKVK